jgi:hypothetical protein
VTFGAKLMSVTEEGDLSPEFEIGIRIDQVETGRRGTGQNVLTDAMKQNFFQMFLAIFFESRDMKLDNGARTSVGRHKRIIAARSHESIDCGLAITKDAAGCMPRSGVAGVIQPGCVASRNQNFRVNTAERFGISVLDDGAMLWHIHV